MISALTNVVDGRGGNALIGDHEVIREGIGAAFMAQISERKRFGKYGIMV